MIPGSMIVNLWAAKGHLEPKIKTLGVFFCGEFNEFKSFVSNKFWKHDVEDYVFAILRNKKIVASIHSTALQWEHKFRMEISLEILTWWTIFLTLLADIVEFLINLFSQRAPLNPI